MGFSIQWLNLRAPADRAARDAALLTRAVAAAGPAPVILDLGCGSGASVRAMAPLLPPDTRWRLVDSDPDLLDLAAVEAGPEAQAVQLDMADVAALPLDGVSLVTASALLDLVSAEWIGALAARLKVPFYAALSYDGEMGWAPEDPRDAAMVAAFNRHQRGNKGFGPALGPAACDTCAERFREAGFEVARAPSPWILEEGEAPLQRALVEGIAPAAHEVGETGAEEWGLHRLAVASGTTCRVGHGDLLAVPKGRGP